MISKHVAWVTRSSARRMKSSRPEGPPARSQGLEGPKTSILFIRIFKINKKIKNYTIKYEIKNNNAAMDTLSVFLASKLIIRPATKSFWIVQLAELVWG